MNHNCSRTFNLNHEDKLLVDTMRFLLKNKKPVSYSENRVSLDYYSWGIDGCYDQETKMLLILDLRDGKTMMKYYPKLECSADFNKILDLLIKDPDQEYPIVINKPSLMNDNKKKYLNRVLKIITLRRLL